MPLISILLIAFGLAMDAFAVSITSGITIKRVKVRQALLVATFFGIFQAVMPILGWWMGQWAHQWISVVDYWVAFALLLFVGGHMILMALQPEEDEEKKNPLHLPTLFMLAVATSIDAFAIGISLSMLRVSIVQPVLIIGLVTFALSFAGIYFGRLFGHLNEKKMEVIGGLVLIGLGTKILIEHLVTHQEIFTNANAVWIALGLTFIAGLGTGVGSLITLFSRQSKPRRLSSSLGISTGLLLWTVFVELLSPLTRQPLPTLAFFGGFLLVALIDRLVPDFGNPHEMLRIEELDKNPDFRRTGMPTLLAISLHSFPEGIALFVVALHSPFAAAICATLGLALHNIPEGLSTSLPMYHASGSRAKACGYSALTGLAEPLSALIFYTLFHRLLTPDSLAGLTAASAGVLVFIALDGLLPAARTYGKYHHAVYGVGIGMLLAMGLTQLIQ